MLNSTPAATSWGQFCCSIAVLVSVPMPPALSCWQNFVSGNLHGLKMALQMKTKQNKTQHRQQTNKSRISFLICFSLWAAPSPWIIVPTWLIWVVQAGKKKSLFQLVLSAKNAASATPVWACLPALIKPRWQWGLVAGRSGQGTFSLSDGCCLCYFCS